MILNSAFFANLITDPCPRKWPRDNTFHLIADNRLDNITGTVRDVESMLKHMLVTKPEKHFAARKFPAF